MPRTYLADVPIAQFIVQSLILVLLEDLAQSQPTTANCLRGISHATLVYEHPCHMLIRIALLLEVDDAGVVGVVVGGDALRHSRKATKNAPLVGPLLGDLACLAILWVVITRCRVPYLQYLC